MAKRCNRESRASLTAECASLSIQPARLSWDQTGDVLERKPAWSAVGLAVMAAGLVGAVLFWSDSKHSTWELGLAIVTSVLIPIGLYWAIAALQGWWPFYSWSPVPIGRLWWTAATSASASVVTVTTWTTEIIKAKFGVPGNWIDVTETLRKNVVGGQVHMMATLEGLGLDAQSDPAFGIVKVLRVAYRSNTRRVWRVEYKEGGTVQLPLGGFEPGG